MKSNIKRIILSLIILLTNDAYSQSINYADSLNMRDVADAFPFISGDGLCIYYQSDRNGEAGSIFYSNRTNTKSYFKAPELLGQQFEGDFGSPTLTSNELTIYVWNGKIKKLFSASRKLRTDAFGALSEVIVLTKNEFYIPAISANGKQLVVTDYENEYLVFFEQNSKNQFELKYDFENKENVFKGARFSPNGLQLYALKKGGAKNEADDILVVFTRKSLTEKFDAYRYVTTAKNELITDVFASVTNDEKTIAVTNNAYDSWAYNDILVYETGNPVNTIDKNATRKNIALAYKYASPKKIITPEPIKKKEPLKKADEPITFTGGQNFDKVGYVAQAINTSTPVYKTFTIPKGNIYEGNTVNGIPNGKGKFTSNNGEVYEGDWVDGKRQGKGKQTYKNGDMYEGDWLNDLQAGKGKYTFNNGELYEGDWRNGKREGKGKATYPSGAIYEGHWVNGVKEGKGNYIFKSGEQYNGDWKNNKREGKGKATFVNRNIYTGDWVDDKTNGNGSLTSLNGDILTGNWINGFIEGDVSYYTKATNTTKTEVYKNGKQVRTEETYSVRDAALEATLEVLHKSSESYFKNEMNEQNLLQNFGNVFRYKTGFTIDGFKQVNIEKYQDNKTVLIAKNSLPEKEATALFNKLKEALSYYTMFISGHNPRKDEQRNGNLLEYRFAGSNRGQITLLLENAPFDIEAPIGSAEKFDVTFKIEKR